MHGGLRREISAHHFCLYLNAPKVVKGVHEGICVEQFFTILTILFPFLYTFSSIYAHQHTHTSKLNPSLYTYKGALMQHRLSAWVRWIHVNFGVNEKDAWIVTCALRCVESHACACHVDPCVCAPASPQPQGPLKPV